MTSRTHRNGWRAIGVASAGASRLRSVVVAGVLASVWFAASPVFATHRIGAVIPHRRVLSPGGLTRFLLVDLDDPEAQFLTLHFESDLEDTDRLIITDSNNQDTIFDASRGTDFWTRPFPGVRVTLTYDDADGDGLGSVELIEYGRGEYAEEIEEGDIGGGVEGTDLFLLNDPFVEPDFGGSGKCGGWFPTWENIACLEADVPEQLTMSRIAESVGLIIAKGDVGKPGVECHVGEPSCLSSCTASWIGSGQILTAGHCFHADAEVASAYFTVDFQSDCLGSPPALYAPQFFKVTGVVATGYTGCPRLDYSILSIDAPGGIGPDPLILMDHDVPLGDELFIVQHPRGSTKKVAANIAWLPGSDDTCEVLNSHGSYFEFKCDLDHGSSGSPVFDLDLGGVIAGVATGGGCNGPDGLNSGVTSTAASDEAICQQPPPLDYEIAGITVPWNIGDPPLRPGDMPGISVNYGLSASGGYKCGRDCYEHLAWIADPADSDTPVGGAVPWNDIDYLRPGQSRDLPLAGFMTPCPAHNGDSYRIVVELNHDEAPPESDFSRNRAETPGTYPVCYPDLTAEVTELSEAICQGECGSTCRAGAPTTLCDADGCDLDRCVVVTLQVCNTGCGSADGVDFDFSLTGENVVHMGGIDFCAPISDLISEEHHYLLAPLAAGTPETPRCRSVDVPFHIPAVPGAVTIPTLQVCGTADPLGLTLDCAMSDNRACEGPGPLGCEEPSCVLDDSCACDPGTDFCLPGEDAGGDGACFAPGCIPPVTDCCDGPFGRLCWAYFPGPGGIQCGDPRVSDLFDFWVEIGDAVQSTDEASVAQALGRILSHIDRLEFGANVTLPLRYLAESEIGTLMGLSHVTRGDLQWVHRLADALDLDLRTAGLEVPMSVPAGTNVQVTLGGGITLTFDQVIATGTITPRFRQIGPDLPTGYHAPVPYFNVDLDSTVGLATGSGVTVTMDYSSIAFRTGADIHLLHEEQGVFVDRTTISNPSAHTVTGRVSGFSRFMLLGAGAVTGIACPPDAVLECPADTSTAARGSATATGNGGPITIGHRDRITPGAGAAQSITRTWSADDGWSGAVCRQILQVADTTPPGITCPPSVLVQCQVGGLANVTLPRAVAADLCDATPVIVNDHTAGGADASGPYPLGATIVTFTATDGSGRGSSCKTTVTVDDPSSADFDQDGIGDLCDNCPQTSNPGQADADLDGHGDACDCAPADPSAWGTPIETTGLVLTQPAGNPDSTALSWGSLAIQAGPGVVYDVLTGSLGSLLANRGFTAYTCLATDEPGTSIVKVQPQPGPPLPTGAWYLVRGETACAPGTWGNGSSSPDPRDPLDVAALCVAPRPLLGIAKTGAPEPVASGGVITYALAYSNTGDASATGVVITDTLPAGTSFVSATAGGTHAAGVVTWSLGTLPAGSSGSVGLVARAASPLPNGTTLVNAGYRIDCAESMPSGGPAVTTTVTSAPIMSISQTDSPDPVPAGSTVTYTIGYSNSGNADATGVVVTDTLPAHATFVSATAGGTLSNGVVSWTIGDLGAGVSGSAQLVVRVDSPLADGTIVTNSTYGVDCNETAPAFGAPVTTTVTSLPSLRVTKVASPDPIQAGGILTYTLDYANDGSAKATRVVIADELPAHTSFVSATRGGALAESTVVWGLGSLGPGAFGSVQMVVRVSSPLPNGTPIVNDNFSIDSDQTAPVMGTPVTALVTSAPVLTLSKSDSPDPVAAGSNLTYAVGFANTGNADATGVILSDAVPSNTTFVSASGGGILSAGVVTWSLGTLAAGSSGTVQMVVRVSSPLPNGTTITNGACSIDSMETSPVTGPPVTTTVTSTPLLGISKTDSPDPVIPGSTIAYSLAYSNLGSDAATGTVIKDSVPANTIFVSASAGGFLSAGVVTWNLGSLPAGSAGTVQMVVRASATLTNGAVITNATYSIDSNETTPLGGPPVTTTVRVFPILAIDMDPSTPTIIETTRALTVPASSLDIGIIVDARGSSGIGDVIRVPFGVINAFNIGGATVTSITPLAIVDIMPPAGSPNNATFAGPGGEFQFGNALSERGVSGAGFTAGPVQYARFRILFGSTPPGSSVRVFIGDNGPGSASIRSVSGAGIGGDATPDGTPVSGTAGSDEGPGAGMNYQDGVVTF